MNPRHRRRRYKCPTCGHRFTTVEVSVPDPGLGGDGLENLRKMFERDTSLMGALAKVCEAVVEAHKRELEEREKRTLATAESSTNQLNTENTP